MSKIVELPTVNLYGRKMSEFNPCSGTFMVIILGSGNAQGGGHLFLNKIK